jgi:hypothetical protein
MTKIIWKFTPVNNTIWYDIREVTYIDNNITMQTIKIEDYKDVLDDLPVFIPKSHIWSLIDFYNQFEWYLYENKQIPLFK